MIIIEQKCHVTYSPVISVCISKNVPADFNTSIHVTGVFVFFFFLYPFRKRERVGDSLMAEASNADLACNVIYFFYLDSRCRMHLFSPFRTMQAFRKLLDQLSSVVLISVRSCRSI